MATYDYNYIENIHKKDVKNIDNTFILGLDFITGLPILNDNDFKKIDGIEALLQNILKFLHTEKEKYLIYDKNLSSNFFGCSILKTIGHIKTDFTLSTFNKEIKEFLLKNRKIKKIEKIESYIVDDNLLIDIVINSIYGNLQVQEVINKKAYE